jgi:hypothetical protein
MLPESLMGRVLDCGERSRGQAARRSPNIGSPLTDLACVASSWRTSQCSASLPFSKRRAERRSGDEPLNQVGTVARICTPSNPAWPSQFRAKEACEYAHSEFKDAGNFLKGGKDWAACLRLAERLDLLQRLRNALDMIKAEYRFWRKRSLGSGLDQPTK